jgi:hypothetical protein
LHSLPYGGIGQLKRKLKARPNDCANTLWAISRRIGLIEGIIADVCIEIEIIYV